ncbi:nucleotidyltransferase family protein [Actinobacillus porcinus]|uniref:nucleotidyltransferase family protein n=1 Tax=Actinobacillus porcinus TaxID=51048 RepID=UPI0023544E03|nr:nucleotidyltransferase family protein [Actinobacillus porcinus]MDD7544379.1 nucleotidyltransferase family protein [Actinobacillus porcinus]MDY5848527.1 nucleotidyltransferase family protein [Actinobacillus porcinus]MDY6216836.1 nucleotidyltransferase family protein [Actinobacillus porcinus]
MLPSQLVKAKQAEILAISHQFALENLRIFGSVAKGVDREGSDLDILVDPTPKTTMFDLCGLQVELEELLGIKVDVLTPRSLPEKFREQVLREAKPL